MANKAENVSVGKPKTGGAIYYAPYGTTMPESTTEELGDAFVCLGYVSEDGLVNGNDITSESIKAWGGDTVLTSQTEFEDTFQFTLIECLNIDVLKAIYGDDNVSEDNGEIHVKVGGGEQEAHSWVVDMVMRNNAIKRIVIPNATRTDLGDITYVDDEAVGYEMTITAVPDSSSLTHHEYIKAADSTTDGGDDGDGNDGDNDGGDDGGDTEPRG